jgi:hypothetical protein
MITIQLLRYRKIRKWEIVYVKHFDLASTEAIKEIVYVRHCYFNVYT